MLASGSLDNTVHIWSMSNGICTAVLRGHSSLVKGVTWDPIGSFIASQSDDKTVIIWRTSDWSLAHRTDGHWAKSVGLLIIKEVCLALCTHAQEKLKLQRNSIFLHWSSLELFHCRMDNERPQSYLYPKKEKKQSYFCRSLFTSRIRSS